MVAINEIVKAAERLGTAAQAERVVLFGSHATGTASETSDVDLLVIAESDEPRYRRARDLYRHLRPHRFPVDVLVYTPKEVARAAQTNVSFLSQALREGRTVYERRT